jgi:predicted TIM-barrel fold metal-dependent hydrolase
MRCDCHVHIVGPSDRYPQVPDRAHLSGLAPVETLQRLGAPHGIIRFVVVQPSFYGTDNSATLDALDQLGGNGRGVAVINPRTTSPEQLAAFHRRGVRGLRLNLYSPIKPPGGDTLEEAFAATVAAARAMNWHVQVIAPMPVLLASFDLLANAPAPVVVDHYGLYGDQRPSSPDGRRLLDLVARPHVWVKLSAPYRMAHGPLNTRPDREWLAALIASAPGRSVWGSDWPHPPTYGKDKHPDVEAPYRPLSYDELARDFIAALPDASLADRIMTDNAARLYGF